tara:strand:+ start:20875 stop:21507 length:633 start_codon:yes stop_codon:yes gene_type:complete
MIGLGNLGLGLGFQNHAALHATPKRRENGGPELLLQSEIIIKGEKGAEGHLVRCVAFPLLEIFEHLKRDPKFLFQFAQHPRKFEEFLAGCYEKAGFDEVILTPQSGDRGRDVIATKRGFGSIRILEQAKAFSPGRLVSHNDVRAMLGALHMDDGASKGIVTTTSNFEPGILKDSSEFAKYMPHRLELKNGEQTLKWINEIASRDAAPKTE